MRKLGMSPAQCTIGIRINNLTNRIGIDEESVETFLTELYTRCQDLGISPKDIAKYVEVILALSEGAYDKGERQQRLHSHKKPFRII